MLSRKYQSHFNHTVIASEKQKKNRKSKETLQRCFYTKVLNFFVGNALKEFC